MRNTLPRKVPGEPGIWLLIAGDLILFSLLFFILLHSRRAGIAQFAESQALLNQNLGLINTLLMLTSSWGVAMAVRSARKGMGEMAGRLFSVALACAIGFVLVKYVEYEEKLRVGITPQTNDFFMYYYVYTGIHLIHVVIGSGALVFLALHARSGVMTAAKLRNIESGASFWHLVDLLWIVLFSLLYLVH